MFQKLVSLAIIFILSVLVTSCNQAPAPEPEKPKGILRITTVPTDMPITVDGQPKGNSPSGAGQYFQIALEEGEHKIEISNSIDEEKKMYGDKTIFIAGDTVQTVTLEAKEHLTPFGEAEKTRREAEATEKKRLAEIERKKVAVIAAKKKRIANEQAAQAEQIAEAKEAKLRRLQTEASEARIILSGHKAKKGCTYCKRINYASFSSDGARAVSGSQDQTAIIWDIQNQKILRVLKGHKDEIYSAVFSPDDQQVLTTSGDRTMKLWDANTGSVIWSVYYSNIQGATFHPDGTKILSFHLDGRAKVWNAKTREGLIEIQDKMGEKIRTAFYSATGQQIITTTTKGTIELWNSNNGTSEMVIVGLEGTSYNTISNDETKIAVLKRNSHVLIKDIKEPKSSKKVKILKSKTSNDGANFSSNGKYIVTFGADISSVIDIAAGKTVARLVRPVPSGNRNSNTSSIESAFFSPDNKRIITPFYDQTVIIWDLEKEIKAWISR